MWDLVARAGRVDRIPAKAEEPHHTARVQYLGGVGTGELHRSVVVRRHGDYQTSRSSARIVAVVSHGARRATEPKARPAEWMMLVALETMATNMGRSS